MLRSFWVRQKSFAKGKRKKTRRAVRPPFVLRPSTSPAFVSPEKSILKQSARGWSTVVEAQRVHPAIRRRCATRVTGRPPPAPWVSAAVGPSLRSEERRVGQGCVITGISRWWPDHKKKKIKIN